VKKTVMRTQYDDGVYFGNAVRLVHGAIAYRDFAMVLLPGSMLLMTPVAVRGQAHAQPDGFPAHQGALAGAGREPGPFGSHEIVITIVGVIS
jgi:hypothetical protein